jgi:hypothetical protein
MSAIFNFCSHVRHNWGHAKFSSRQLPLIILHSITLAAFQDIKITQNL